MRFLVRTTVVTAACCLAACATAASSGAGDDDDAPPDAAATDVSLPADAPAIDAAPPIDAPVMQTVTLSQSSSMAITADNAVACSQNTTGYTRENSYYRVFRLADHGVNRPFVPQRVDVGIEAAVGGVGGSQSIQVKLHTLNGAFQLVNLTPVAGQTVNVPNAASGTVIQVPLSPQPPVPAPATLVAEVFVPDGLAQGNQFFIGSNTATETQPSYVRGPTCNLNEPVTFAAAGFPSTHIVLTVTGTY